MTGVSRSSATRRSLLRTERRAASVGWAVNTGRTFRFRTVSRRCSASASLSRSAVRARRLPSAARRARSSRPRCTCSVTFARWKYVEKARTSLAAVSSSVSPSRRAAASPSSRVRRRTFSTSSRSSGPSWRTSVSPRRSPSRRMSARSSALEVASRLWSSALLTGAAPCSVEARLGGKSREPGMSPGWRFRADRAVRPFPRIGVRPEGPFPGLLPLACALPYLRRRRLRTRSKSSPCHSPAPHPRSRPSTPQGTPHDSKPRSDR